MLRGWLSLASVALVLAGCPQGNAVRTPVARTSSAPRPVVVPASPRPSLAIAGLSGHVYVPAGIISDNGAGAVGAFGEVPFAGAKVALFRADGTPVLGPDKQPVAATADAKGAYTLPALAGEKNVVLKVELPGGKGSLQGIGSGEQAGQTVDLDGVSTLTTTYILDKFVRGQNAPQAVLDRLPLDVEADTRAKAAQALKAGGIALPETFTPEVVVAAVEELRKRDATVDKQLDYVRSLLVAGLSNQGIGRKATEVDIFAQGLALAPDGLPVMADPYANRVWKLDVEGNLRVLAGTGVTTGGSHVRGQPVPGDGGPADKAPLRPWSLAYDKAGNLYVADRDHFAIRRIDPSGTISTYALFPEGLQALWLATRADGSLFGAYDRFVWSFAPDKVEVFAGTATPGKDNGDGGSALNASFEAIKGLATGTDGDVYVLDDARVRRIRAGKIGTSVGTGQSAFGGDDGPATAAKIGGFGGLSVDPDGNLLIGDLYHHRVRQVVNGTIRTIAGSGEQGLAGDGGPPLAAEFLAAGPVVASPDGTIYVADNGRVRKIAGGVITTVAGLIEFSPQPRSIEGVNIMPAALVYEPASNGLLFSEMYRIRRLRLDTQMVETVAGDGYKLIAAKEGDPAVGTFLKPLGGNLQLLPDGALAFTAEDADGACRIFELREGKLHLVAGAPRDGNPAHYVGEGPVATTQLWPHSQIAYADGTYYVAGGASFVDKPEIRKHAAQVRRLDADGRWQVVAGGGKAVPGTDTPGLEVTFDGLYSVAHDPFEPVLYVSEFAAIDRIDLRTGTVTRYAGTGVAGTSQNVVNDVLATTVPVEGSDHMTFDAAGNLYINGYQSRTVRRIDRKTGVITGVAGVNGANLAGDEVDTSLSAPEGLAFDAQGNLFIADLAHHQIKRIPAQNLSR